MSENLKQVSDGMRISKDVGLLSIQSHIRRQIMVLTGAPTIVHATGAAVSSPWSQRMYRENCDCSCCSWPAKEEDR